MNTKRMLAAVLVAVIAIAGGLAAGHWFRGAPPVWHADDD